MTPPNIIHLNQIDKSYKQGDQSIAVLHQLSLTVVHGEMLAILGTSGSGKSTLMNIIGLLDSDYIGQYYLLGQLVSGLADHELSKLRNRSIGFVFQQFHLLARLTALQNVALPMLYRGLNNETSEEMAHQALHRVGMGSFAHRRPSQLSGGQQQRIAIARALVGSPQVILADEPTGALDSKTSDNIMSLFHELHESHTTIILITHEEVVAKQCRRQVHIHDGVIIQDSAS